jgi:flagellar protein FliO/FliZ
MFSATNSRHSFALTCFFYFCQAPEVARAGSSTLSQMGDMESYSKVIWGLLVVLGIILALYGLLRKRFSLLSTAREKNIVVLEIKPLMGKKALCLISVKGNEYLLSISGDQINHIATLPNKMDSTFAAALKSTELDQRP